MDRESLSAFDAASALTATDGVDTWAVELGEQWTVGGRPNGGYLLAILARAAVAGLDGVGGGPHPHPLAASATFLRAPMPGPALVRTEVLRAGRSASQVRARLEQDGNAAVEAVCTLGTLTAGIEPWWVDAPPLDVPPMDACTRLPADREGADFRVAIMEVADVRLDPAVLGFAAGRPGGGGELRGWFAFDDGRPVDPLALLFALDAYPPATFELVASGWVPTLELTTYVRALPAPGPVRVRQRARLVQGGLVDEICEIWDARGALVATATQLAGIRLPEA